MSGTWGRWLILLGGAGLGAALLFARQAPGEEPSPVPVSPAGGPLASASAARGFPRGADARESGADAPLAAAPSGTPSGVPAESPPDAASASPAPPPLDVPMGRPARGFFVGEGAEMERRPMPYAQPPGARPETAPNAAPGSGALPVAQAPRDPKEYGRYLEERLVGETWAQVETFTRAIQKQEEKLARAEASGASEEERARYREKLERLRAGQEKFRAKALLLESRLGRSAP